MKRFDVVALGELLIDFTQNGLSEQGNPLFEANPGGAPCNVLAMLQKLGRKTAFIGKVGKDGFGEQLRAVAGEAGIDLTNLLTDPEVHTTLAIVHTKAGGDRDFSFYRNPGADMMLREDELPPGMLKDCRIFHFGTLSMTHDGVRAATKKAVKTAKEAGALISYDPNYRDRLWSERGHAIVQMKEPLPMVDILKISDEELPLLSGSTDPLEGSRILHEQYGIKLIFVTLGADGALFRYGDITGQIPCPPIVVGDTNGAGDTFFGAALSKICKLPSLDGLDEETLRAITTFANKAASITTSRHGAIPAMPQLSEVE